MLISIKTKEFKHTTTCDTKLPTFLGFNGFEESHYRNDICPSYALDHNCGEKELRVFVDFDKKELKENPDLPKYIAHLNMNGATFKSLETDDPEKVINFLKALIEWLKQSNKKDEKMKNEYTSICKAHSAVIEAKNNCTDQLRNKKLFRLACHLADLEDELIKVMEDKGEQ